MKETVDLRRLRSFVVVAEELHFGRAARRLNMSQPPLSVQIRQLETRVGTALFVRTQRQVELTAPGRVLLAAARDLLARADAAVDLARRAARGDVGRLALGFVSTADYSVLPALVRRFREQHPGVTLTLHELTGDRQLDLLMKGDLDLGLMIAPPPTKGLAQRTVLREALIAALPTGHRLARTRGAIDLRALASDGFVLFPRELAPGLHDLVIAACRRAGFAPRLAQEAIQMQTILGLAAAGLGVALVPACMANLRRSDVAYMRLRGAKPAIETRAVWRADDRSPALAALLQGLNDCSTLRKPLSFSR